MDEPSRSAAEFEERVGKRWSTWAGAIALILAGGFYMQLASGRGWIGPTAKLAIAIVAGAFAVFLGDRALRRDARVLGMGLVGAGLGVVFGALYAGHALYGLYDPEPAAAALVVVVGAGMLLAVRHDAAPIAILAVLGGYLIPVMSSRGGDAGHARDALFAYLTVLDLGVLGVAIARRWRALERLAFLGTWVLFAGWYHKTAAPGPAVTLAWCAGFFAIFLAVPLAYHLRRRIALSRDRLALVLLDGAFAFGFACEILDGVAARLAWVSLALAAAYVVLAILVRRRLAGDQLAHAAFAIVATGFATLAAPLALRSHGLLLAWALEAPVLVWLGTRYRLALVRHAGFVVLALATTWLFFARWPFHYEPFTPFLNAPFASAMSVVAAAVLHAVLAQRAAVRFHDPLGQRFALWSGLIGAVLTFALVSHEAWRQAIVNVADPIRAEWLGHAAVSCAWSVMAGAGLALGFRLRLQWVRLVALALFIATVAKVVIVDLSQVHEIYRVASFLVLGLLLFSTSWLYHRAGALIGRGSAPDDAPRTREAPPARHRWP